PQDLPRQQLLRHWIRHHDKLQRERTDEGVERRVHLTLALRRGEGGDIVTQRLRPAISADRHAQEIDRLARVAVVVLSDALPGAGEIDLGGRGSRGQDRHDDQYRGTLSGFGHWAPG